MCLSPHIVGTILTASTGQGNRPEVQQHMERVGIQSWSSNWNLFTSSVVLKMSPLGEQHQPQPPPSDLSRPPSKPTGGWPCSGLSGWRPAALAQAAPGPPCRTVCQEPALTQKALPLSQVCFHDHSFLLSTVCVFSFSHSANIHWICLVGRTLVWRLWLSRLRWTERLYVQRKWRRC